MLHARTITTRGLRSIILLAILVAAMETSISPASAQGTMIDRSTTFNALASGQLCTDAGCSDASVTIDLEGASITTTAAAGLQVVDRTTYRRTVNCGYSNCQNMCLRPRHP